MIKTDLWTDMKYTNESDFFFVFRMPKSGKWSYCGQKPNNI